MTSRPRVDEPRATSDPPMLTAPGGRPVHAEGSRSAQRILPKLPKAGTGPTPLPEPDEVAVELDVAVDELGKALDLAASPSSAPSRMPPSQLPAICTFGRYEILGRIAFGGMAEIFLGREVTAVGATRMLAIKRILPHVADDPAFVEMFLDEARLAIQLNHPQICHIYEFGELEGSYFIAMEWIWGAPLGKIIRRARGKGGLPPEFVAKTVALVAEALHYAHRARDSDGRPLGIVHRDVSPQNIMVSYEGQVKLLDFGIAKAQSHTTKTQAGVVKGKFAYMSPQQCMGKPIDARADIFALGVVLYEALVGETLYHRPTEYETMRAVIEDPVPSIRDKKPDLPVELDAIVQKALQKRPEDRFQTAADMQSALEEWLARSGKAVTTAKIATVMESLFEEQIAAGPLVDSTPFGASFQRRKGADGSVPSGVALVGSSPGSQGARASSPNSEGAAPLDPDALFADVGPSAVTRPASISGAHRAAAASADANVSAAPSAPAPPAPTNSVAAPPASASADGGLARWLPTILALVAVLLAGVIAAVVIGMREEPRTVTITQLVPTPAAPTEPPPAAPPPPPPAPTEGSIRVVGPLDGLTVRIGERSYGAAELAEPVLVPPGRYAVRAEREGHRPWESEVVVTAGQQVTVTPELVALAPGGGGAASRPAAPPATLSINTRPWSRVWIGSRELGTTPIGEATVPSGTVRLRIVDRDGRTFTRTVRLAPGANENVFFDLDQNE